MLVEVSGDIFESPLQTITCPVNSVGVMGAGLALHFRRRYPNLYQQYRGLCRALPNSFYRTIHVVPLGRSGKQCLLFPTKRHWKGFSTVEQINYNLALLARTYQTHGITSLALPALGCGLGGLDYQTQVLPLIRQYLDPLSLTVHLYRV